VEENNTQIEGKARYKKPLWMRIILGLVFVTMVSSGILYLCWRAGYPLVYVNNTKSTAKGIYVREFTGDLYIGGYVIMRLPKTYGKLQKGSLLLKQVQAFPGDEYIREGNMLLVRSKRYPLSTDARMPQIPQGKHVVPDGMILLLNERNNSFDGRYIGPVSQDTIVARVRLVFNKEIFWEHEKRLHERLKALLPGVFGG